MKSIFFMLTIGNFSDFQLPTLTEKIISRKKKYLIVVWFTYHNILHYYKHFNFFYLTRSVTFEIQINHKVDKKNLSKEMINGYNCLFSSELVVVIQLLFIIIHH